MAARRPLALGTDGHPAQLQAGDWLQLPSFTVAQLAALTGVLPGAFAFASDGRALTGLAGVVEASPGNGVHVSYTAAGAWKIVGTIITVSA